MVAAGTRFGDRYVVGEVLGWGGSAKVHRALDENLDREVALKIVHVDDEDAQRRLQREAAVAARVIDPHVVAVLDTGMHPEPYVVMQLVEGRSLAEVVKEQGPLTPGAIIDLARGLLEGSTAIHGAGIVHRDINPNNVLIDDKGTVRITDFGLAKGAGDASITDSGIILGTASFVAPERRRGKTADKQSDLYEIGATLYYAATGRAPADDEGRLPDGLAVRPLLESLLSRRPDRRPADSAAALELVPEPKRSTTAHLTSVVGPAADTTRVVATTPPSSPAARTSDTARRIGAAISDRLNVDGLLARLRTGRGRRGAMLALIAVVAVVALLALPSADPTAPPAYDQDRSPADNAAELADWLDAVTDE